MTTLYQSVIDTITMDGVSGKYAQKRINDIAMVDTFAAKRVEDDLEALLLEVEPSELSGIQEWPLSDGFRIDIGPVSPGSRSMVRLHLQLTEPRYRKVFFVLCEDVCSVISGASGKRDAIRACHSRLVRWQAFLKAHREDGLSAEEQVGLFGELLVLRNLFLPRLDPALCIRAWRGCKKAHQDFQFPDRALEVKTTHAVIPDKISISNVQQLDEDGMAALVLTVVHVHSNETSGETLPEMIHKIRESLPDDARAQFRDGLMEVGYLDAHEKLYAKPRYVLIRMLHHEVGNGFPRILRNQLADGIKKVRYQISIDAIKPFLIEENRVHEIFQKVKDADGD